MAAAGGLAGTPAFGQGAVPCTAIDDDAARLACYDRALRPAPAPTAPAAASAPTAAPTAPAAAAVVAAPIAAAAAPAATPAPAAAPAAAAAAPAAAAPAASATPRESIVPIVVVGVNTLTGRETTFTAADGTRWVQTDSQRIIGLPEPPFDAEIKPGAMGSRFLLPKGHSRAIRVRLVR